VIVDGSITKTSPATFSNLAVGKHQLQIVLEGYTTKEQEVEIKEGQVASQGIVTLHAREQPQAVATPRAEEEPPNQAAQKENEQKANAATKATHNNRPAKAQVKKSASPITRQAPATPPPSAAKTVSKPVPTPKPSAEPKRQKNPFGESAPGG
jgi:hypothetical protein